MIVGTSVGWCGSCDTAVIVRSELHATCKCGQSNFSYGHGNPKPPAGPPKLRLIKGEKA